MKRLYGKHYNFYPIYVTPGDQGHTGVARDRVYVAMALKGKAVPITDVRQLYERVTSFIKQFVSTRPRDYWVSSSYDKIVEASKTALQRRLPVRKVRSVLS